jgi:MFS family permease
VWRSITHLVAWCLANLFGFVFAGIGSHFPGSFPVGSGVVGAFEPGAASFGLIIGTVGGLVIGTLQWLVLRSWIGMRWPWLAATAVAVGVAHALGDGLPSSLEWPPLALVGGLVMATAQWVALRDRADRAPLALASGVVFALAVIVGVTVADPRSADWQLAHVIAGAVSGGMFGALYGAVVFWNSGAGQHRPSVHMPA